MSTYKPLDQKKITTATLRRMKASGDKIAMLTAYDYTMARLVDEGGADAILIGDSASNVVQGNKTTLAITLDEMIVYARSVARGAKRAFVLCDMPFGSYQISPSEAVANAVRIMRETGVECVKIEGGEEMLPAIRAIIGAGIPVCGHLGLTPQSINAFGSFGVRAKEEAEAAKLLRDVELLNEAGCCMIVLEKIPAALAAEATKRSAVPIIGIGAGSACDGQVLVCTDMLGCDPSFSPRFVRRYADLHAAITDAVGAYTADVKSGHFPSTEESF